MARASSRPGLRDPAEFTCAPGSSAGTVGTGAGRSWGRPGHCKVLSLCTLGQEPLSQESQPRLALSQSPSPGEVRKWPGGGARVQRKNIPGMQITSRSPAPRVPASPLRSCSGPHRARPGAPPAARVAQLLRNVTATPSGGHAQPGRPCRGPCVPSSEAPRRAGARKSGVRIYAGPCALRRLEAGSFLPLPAPSAPAPLSCPPQPRQTPPHPGPTEWSGCRDPRAAEGADPSPRHRRPPLPFCPSWEGGRDTCGAALKLSLCPSSFARVPSGQGDDAAPAVQKSPRPPVLTAPAPPHSSFRTENGLAQVRVR
ncbi:PREDICTED: vegetative cell wall protein gp1-like [Chinchilla lanigera]|uniref:vegetative cell wall protein gp1-like n=1 Tax=Chinchilla lanigera TaxID=34839 RepID=UPI00038EF41B|nr:PREDICTED: vegetative cell wall protein gp1-like [Chinchilla lanigera]